jgi:hypothetical protein
MKHIIHQMKYHQRDILTKHICPKMQLSVPVLLLYGSVVIKVMNVINLYDTKSNATIFTSGTLPFNAATKPVKLNNTGDFIYSDPENAKSREAGVNGFVMTGTVKLVNQPSSSSTSVASNNTTTTTATNSNATKIDTIGVLMVPAKTVNQYISEFKSRGFAIDSTQEFKALRSNGQHVLLVWTSNGMDLNKVLAGLNQITATLPYS